MQFVKGHKKLSIIILGCLAFFVFFTATFGRYIYNFFGNYILETKGFYFNSSVLNMNTKEFKINNWDGVNSYSVTVDLNNMKNSLVHTEADIEYDVAVSCSNGVTCTTSKESGILREENITDGFVVSMTPDTNTKFEAGDEVEISVLVTSKSPYTKVLKGKFIISVENENFSYEIVDDKNDIFMMLKLTNSVAFYEVEKAFGSYNVGDVIGMDDYSKLTDAEKNNCFSAKVTIAFDPKIIFLDMTSKSYLHGSNITKVVNPDDGFEYVNGYQFKIDATSSEKIIFYKANRSDNYTYPIVNDKSIVDVKVELAG